MSLPTAYAWLGDPKLAPLPKTIQVGLRLLGIHEVEGPGSNPVIVQWRDALKAAGHNVAGLSDDDVPWCGLFVAFVLMQAGKPVVKDPLWARNWANYGTAVAGTSPATGGSLVFKKDVEPSLGDVMVYQRPGGGGHVEFYIAETAKTYIGLGGNKSNQVQISAIDKERCIAVRRPPMTVAPASMKPYHIAASGKVTQDEA